MPIATVANQATVTSAQSEIRPQLITCSMCSASALRCAGTQSDKSFFRGKDGNQAADRKCSENLAHDRLLIVLPAAAMFAKSVTIIGPKPIQRILKYRSCGFVASFASVTHTPHSLQPYVCISLSPGLPGIVRVSSIGLPQLGHAWRQVGRSSSITTR